MNKGCEYCGRAMILKRDTAWIKIRQCGSCGQDCRVEMIDIRWIYEPEPVNPEAFEILLRMSNLTLGDEWGPLLRHKDETHIDIDYAERLLLQIAESLLDKNTEKDWLKRPERALRVFQSEHIETYVIGAFRPGFPDVIQNDNNKSLFLYRERNMHDLSDIDQPGWHPDKSDMTQDEYAEMIDAINRKKGGRFYYREMRESGLGVKTFYAIDEPWQTMAAPELRTLGLENALRKKLGIKPDEECAVLLDKDLNEIERFPVPYYMDDVLDLVMA